MEVQSAQVQPVPLKELITDCQWTAHILNEWMCSTCHQSFYVNHYLWRNHYHYASGTTLYLYNDKYEKIDTYLMYTTTSLYLHLGSLFVSWLGRLMNWRRGIGYNYSWVALFLREGIDQDQLANPYIFITKILSVTQFQRGIKIVKIISVPCCFRTNDWARWKED